MSETQPTDRPIRTFIFGSCVSRDTFGYLGDGFHLVRYVARQSAISAGTDAASILRKLTRITSSFQERVVRGDLAGHLPRMLAASAADVDLVLMDLVDERGGVIDIGGGYVTKLAEFWRAGGREATRGMLHHAFGTDEHFALWQAGIARLVEQLSALGLLSRTLVLRTPWANRHDDGTSLEIPAWMMEPTRADALYGRYFDTLAGHGLAIVELPQELAKSPRDHQWGPSPFHYTPEAYTYLAEAIGRFVELNRPGSDGGSQSWERDDESHGSTEEVQR